MKSKLLIILLVSLSLFLSGCNFDESFESNQQHDGDDMDVIRDIWPQALDQMLQWEKSESIGESSDQTSQTSSITQWLDTSPGVSLDTSSNQLVDSWSTQPSYAPEKNDDFFGEDD